MSRFKFGVCEWSLTERGRAFCEAAAGQKLDCIQLGVGEEALTGHGLGDPALAEEYAVASAELGIEINSLSPQFVDQYGFTAPKSGFEEQLVVELVERTIALAAGFGCRSFLLPVLGQNGIFDGPSFHRAVEYIKRFSHEAAERGMETHLEINQSVAGVRNLLHAVDNPAVKIFFDSQNLYAFDGTAMAPYFTELADVIGGVHVKDGDGPLLSGSLLGEGSSGFEKTARAIVASNYTGSVIIESVYNKPSVSGLGSPSELFARDVKRLFKAFVG